MAGRKEWDTAIKIKRMAVDALRESKFEKVFSAAGAGKFDETAGSALKALLAEKTAEYTIRAMREAKKRRMRLGAAALIIAAERDRW